MFTKTQYKVAKVKVDGVRRFVPMRKTSFLGFGKWEIDPEWNDAVQNRNEERFLGLKTDSTLTMCHAFVNQRKEKELKNRFYNE